VSARSQYPVDASRLPPEASENDGVARLHLAPDRKDEDGRIIVWDEIKRFALPRIESDPRSYIRHEIVAVEELGSALADAGVKLRETSN
jgi:hypothetical protein